MGEKLYRPIIKDGDHLVRSSKNPDRVRGQSRNSENKNPDIIEWEEVMVEEVYGHEPIPYEERQVQLSPEEEQFAQAIGEALAEAAFWTIENVVAPWWNKTAWPWIKEKGRSAIEVVSGKKKTKAEQIIDKKKQDARNQNVQLEAISTQIDQTFEQVYIDMDPEEAKRHLMKIIFHMLEIANEIRIMSNAQIRKNGESEKDYNERIEVTERYLTKKVAENIDKLLAEQKPRLDVKTTKELFGMFGGGVIMNGEYVPVERSKVFEAIVAQND